MCLVVTLHPSHQAAYFTWSCSSFNFLIADTASSAFKIARDLGLSFLPSVDANNKLDYYHPHVVICECKRMLWAGAYFVC